MFAGIWVLCNDRYLYAAQGESTRIAQSQDILYIVFSDSFSEKQFARIPVPTCPLLFAFVWTPNYININLTLFEINITYFALLATYFLEKPFNESCFKEKATSFSQI